MERAVYIVGGCRTGIGSYQGQFSATPSRDLAAAVIESLLQQAKVPPEDISAVILGQVLTSGLGPNPTRQAAVKAKIPSSVPSYSVNMVCGSSLRAIYDGYLMIGCDSYDVVIAGGVENMTLTTHASYCRNDLDMGPLQFENCIITNALNDMHLQCPTGKMADILAKKFNISREAQDKYSYESHMKAANAIDNGYFNDELIQVFLEDEPISSDENVRADVSMENLGNYQPEYSKDEGASVTKGNSAGISDGAAAVILCSESVVANQNFTPLAKIIAFSQVSLDPRDAGLATVNAIKSLMDNAGWKVHDVDLFEINESFAVEVLVVFEELNINPMKVNVSGGAIALGNPLGAAGARILVTLCHNMKRLCKSKGVAVLSVEGGMAIAVAVEGPKN